MPLSSSSAATKTATNSSNRRQSDRLATAAANILLSSKSVQKNGSKRSANGQTSITSFIGGNRRDACPSTSVIGDGSDEDNTDCAVAANPPNVVAHDELPLDANSDIQADTDAALAAAISRHQSLVAERDSQRTHVQSLFEDHRLIRCQIASLEKKSEDIRKEMAKINEELMGLDDEIDAAEKAQTIATEGGLTNISRTFDICNMLVEHQQPQGNLNESFDSGGEGMKAIAQCVAPFESSVSREVRDDEIPEIYGGTASGYDYDYDPNFDYDPDEDDQRVAVAPPAPPPTMNHFSPPPAAAVSTPTSNVLSKTVAGTGTSTMCDITVSPPSLISGSNNGDDAYFRSLSSDNFPWSQELLRALNNNFRISAFRNNQKEIINCTMLGDDAFVIMRTGGGKSLTYQLPAFLEGRGSARKITLVVSPLLSLIRDQDEQMNAFVEGSAVSFTSGMGTGVHAENWRRVRDPEGGVCLIFVTPEKISQSNKLKSELEKLNYQERLGRFVIDEAHCATQWGHDFRPDYTKLGFLKTHFPDVPLIAVTATASDRVREDCCRILRLGTNHQLFRSSANRPNLRYSIRRKAGRKDQIVKEMADFIKQHHQEHAGIVYTLSRADADDVAASLNSLGITAAAYHSSISEGARNRIHSSWMKNRTRIVVATIAFGLGINKPDVRFVLHHSISKSLEAYYQESGRAGRDGGPANCVLFYSPKDVARMLCMVHGDNGERTLWSVVKYAQLGGNDKVCRNIILRNLGEEGVTDDIGQSNGVVDVTIYAKTVTRLVQMLAKDDCLKTLNALVLLWRGGVDKDLREVPEFVKDNLPNKDLTKDECERVVISLIIAQVLEPKVVWSSPYMSYMYITTGPRACDIVNNSSSKIEIPLPDHKLTASTLSGSKKPKRKESSISRKNEKKKKGRRKSSLKTKRGQQKSPKKVPNHSSSPVENSSNTYHSQSKIICLDSSSEIDGLIDGSEDENNGWYQRLPPRRAKSKQRKIIEQSGSDSLDDFDLHSDENLS